MCPAVVDGAAEDAAAVEVDAPRRVIEVLDGRRRPVPTSNRSVFRVFRPGSASWYAFLRMRAITLEGSHGETEAYGRA